MTAHLLCTGACKADPGRQLLPVGVCGDAVLVMIVVADEVFFCCLTLLYLSQEHEGRKDHSQIPKHFDSSSSDH